MGRLSDKEITEALVAWVEGLEAELNQILRKPEHRAALDFLKKVRDRP